MSRPAVLRRLLNRVRGDRLCLDSGRCFLEPGHSGAHRLARRVWLGDRLIWDDKQIVKADEL